MLEWLKWRLARAEMAELTRWRSSWSYHRRWFAEFDAASTVLDLMQCDVLGEKAEAWPMCSIMHERDELRKRTATNTGVTRRTKRSEVNVGLTDLLGCASDDAFMWLRLWRTRLRLPSLPWQSSGRTIPRGDLCTQ